MRAVSRCEIETEIVEDDLRLIGLGGVFEYCMCIVPGVRKCVRRDIKRGFRQVQ